MNQPTRIRPSQQAARHPYTAVPVTGLATRARSIAVMATPGFLERIVASSSHRAGSPWPVLLTRPIHTFVSLGGAVMKCVERSIGTFAVLVVGLVCAEWPASDRRISDELVVEYDGEVRDETDFS